jgi:hypothetical protein
MLLCIMAGVGKLPSSSHNMPGGETNVLCLVIAVSSVFCVSVCVCWFYWQCLSNFPTDHTSHGIRLGEWARHKGQLVTRYLCHVRWQFNYWQYRQLHCHAWRTRVRIFVLLITSVFKKLCKNLSTYISEFLVSSDIGLIVLVTLTALYLLVWNYCHPLYYFIYVNRHSVRIMSTVQNDHYRWL